MNESAMPAAEIVLRIAVLALLVVYLYRQYSARERKAWEQVETKRTGTGEAFDAAAIAPRIDEVRSNYSRQLKSQPHEADCKAALLALFRKALNRFGYFQNH